MNSLKHLNTSQISWIAGWSLAWILIGWATLVPRAQAADTLNVTLHYIEHRIERPPVLSNLIAWPEDEGLRGAELGVDDNNSTGRFMNQAYELVTTVVESGEDVVAAAQQVLGAGSVLAILNVSAADLLTIADLPEAQDDLLFNARAADNRLRDGDCRANVFHTMASRSMLTDGLMQFLALRRWNELFLISGNRDNDVLLAESMRGSAKKFGLKVVEDKAWIDDADMRRNAAQEVPRFTQAGDYDAVLVADEDRDFSPYVEYNTWLARPVVGTAGLQPKVWSRVVEQWGAAQLQSRFVKLAMRDMNSVDYANWAAARSVAEAVTRTSSTDVNVVRDYLVSDQFELAGFKGFSLSFRTWNGQLRQSVPLVSADAVVANTPLEGFLHQNTELDTLGLDEPESSCQSFAN